MAQAVRRRSVTVEFRVRSQVSPCETCGGQFKIGTCFSPSTSVFPLSVSIPQMHFSYQKEKRAKPENLPDALSEIGKL
jgi:hypothetical protein